MTRVLTEEQKIKKSLSQKIWLLKHREEINQKQRLKFRTPEQKEKSRIYREKNKVKIALKAKEAYLRNREKINARRRIYMSNPEVRRRYQIKHREFQYKRNYGISINDYEVLLTRQNGKCAICGGTQDILCIDHHHESGVVRGLLCSDCNLSLGGFKDSPTLLQSAINYLNNPPASDIMVQDKVEESHLCESVV